MSIRSKWCDPDKETRKYILKRDKHCIFCGNKNSLTMVHVFLSRAQGGKGSKENNVAGCTQCHYFLLDNPIGKVNNEKSKQMLDYAKKHLIEKENITYNKQFIESLKYKKSVDTLSPLAFGYDIKKEVKTIGSDKCGNCSKLVKNKFGNSSIPSYYCTLKRKIVSRKSNVCEDYKEAIK
jgi:hypothetical protein